MRRARLLACVVLAACNGSSEPEPFTALPTSELALGATIRSNGAVTQIEASLFKADLHPVTLAAPDRLLVALGSLEAELVPFQGHHLGQVAASGTDAAVILERAGGERITSHVTLPPLFVLSGPPDPLDVSQPVVITWESDPGDFHTRVEVDSDCFSTIFGDFDADPGTFAFTVPPLSHPADATGCDITVEVTRSLAADMPASGLAPGAKSNTSQIRTLVLPLP